MMTVENVRGRLVVSILVPTRTPCHGVWLHKLPNRCLALSPDVHCPPISHHHLVPRQLNSTHLVQETWKTSNVQLVTAIAEVRNHFGITSLPKRLWGFRWTRGVSRNQQDAIGVIDHPLLMTVITIEKEPKGYLCGVSGCRAKILSTSSMLILHIKAQHGVRCRNP